MKKRNIFLGALAIAVLAITTYAFTTSPKAKVLEQGWYTYNPAMGSEFTYAAYTSAPSYIATCNSAPTQYQLKAIKLTNPVDLEAALEDEESDVSLAITQSLSNTTSSAACVTGGFNGVEVDAEY